MSKDALLQQSFSTLFNQSFEQFKSEAKPNTPFALSAGFEGHFYLPSPDAALKLLGITNPFLSGIEASEESLALPLDVKRSSRHKLTSSGVGLPTLKKFVDWIGEVLDYTFTADSIVSERKMFETFQVNSNAIGWYSCIVNSEDMQAANSIESMSIFKPLLGFLIRRCEADVVVQQQVKAKLLSTEFDKGNLACQLKAQDPLWFTHSNLDNEVWLKLSKLLIQNAKSKIKEPQKVLEVAKCVVQLQLDFYLEAMAHFEAGWVLAKHAGESGADKPDGILTRSILFFTDGKSKTCFDGFLHELKRVCSIKLGEDVSWRRLARFIDVDEGEQSRSGELLEDKQYARLKRWRKGEGAISNDKLESFVVNLVGPEDFDSIIVLLSYAHITLGLDKLLAELTTQYKDTAYSDDDFKLIYQEVLAQYPSYYLRCIECELAEVTVDETQ